MVQRAASIPAAVAPRTRVSLNSAGGYAIRAKAWYEMGPGGLLAAVREGDRARVAGDTRATVVVPTHHVASALAGKIAGEPSRWTLWRHVEAAAAGGSKTSIMLGKEASILSLPPADSRTGRILDVSSASATRRTCSLRPASRGSARRARLARSRTRSPMLAPHVGRRR